MVTGGDVIGTGGQRQGVADRQRGIAAALGVQAGIQLVVQIGAALDHNVVGVVAPVAGGQSLIGHGVLQIGQLGDRVVDRRGGGAAVDEPLQTLGHNLDGGLHGQTGAVNSTIDGDNVIGGGEIGLVHAPGHSGLFLLAALGADGDSFGQSRQSVLPGGSALDLAHNGDDVVIGGSIALGNLVGIQRAVEDLDVVEAALEVAVRAVEGAAQPGLYIGAEVQYLHGLVHGADLDAVLIQGHAVGGDDQGHGGPAVHIVLGGDADLFLGAPAGAGHGNIGAVAADALEQILLIALAHSKGEEVAAGLFGQHVEGNGEGVAAVKVYGLAVDGSPGAVAAVQRQHAAFGGGVAVQGQAFIAGGGIGGEDGLLAGLFVVGSDQVAGSGSQRNARQVDLLLGGFFVGQHSGGLVTGSGKSSPAVLGVAALLQVLVLVVHFLQSGLVGGAADDVGVGVDGIQLQRAGLHNHFHLMGGIGQAGGGVGLVAAAGGHGGGGLVQLAVHIHFQLGAGAVRADQSEAGALHSEAEGGVRGGVLGDGAVPVVGTAAAGIVDAPAVFVGHAVVLTVDHGGGIGDVAVQGLDLEVIKAGLGPAAGQLDATGKHGKFVHILGHQLAVDVGQDGGSAAFHLQGVAVGGGDIALRHHSAVTLQGPSAVGRYGEGIAVIVGAHTALAADHEGGIAGDLGDVHAGGIVHPAEVAHHRHRIAAVPLADAAGENLGQLAVLHHPRAMAVQHIAGLVAAGGEVVGLGALAGDGVVNVHIRLFGVLEIVGVQVLVVGHAVLTAGDVGVQHVAVFIVDAFLGQALGFHVHQSSGGDHAVGRNRHIPHAVGALYGALVLHVAVGLGGPHAQLGVIGDVQAVGGDAEGFGVLGVVDHYHREIGLVGSGQGQVAGIAVDAGGHVLVVAAAEGAVAGGRNGAPDLVLGGIAVLPAGLGERGEVGGHVEGGIVVDVAAPGITGADELLVTVLDALVKAADGRLENVVGAAGSGEGVDVSIHQCQRTLVAADALIAVLGGLVLLQLAVAEGGAALAVPHLFVVHVGHGHIVRGGVGAVVETDDVHRVVQLFVGAHGGHDLQALILIGSNDADVVVGVARFLIHVVGELGLTGHAVLEPLDERLVGVAGLVGVRVHEIHHIAVLFVGVEDGLAVPDIHGLIALVVDVVVPLVLHPAGHTPAQDADLDVGIDLLGVGCHREAGRTGGVRRFILAAHGAGLGAGGVVAVVAHLHLDMGEQRILAAEQVLHHLPVLLGVLALVVQQQVTGAVAVQHAPALIGEAVDVLGSGVHIGAVDGHVYRLHTAQLAVQLLGHRVDLGLALHAGILGQQRFGLGHSLLQRFGVDVGNTGSQQRLRLGQRGLQLGGVGRQVLLGGLTGSGFGDGGGLVDGCVGDNDVVIQAFLQIVGVEGAGDVAHNAFQLAHLEAHIGHLGSLLTVQIHGHAAVAAFGLVVHQSQCVPAGLVQTLQVHQIGADAAAVAAPAELARPGGGMQAVGAGAQREADALVHTAGITAGLVHLDVGQQGERAASEQLLCVVDGGVVVVGVVPLHVDFHHVAAAGDLVQDGAGGVGEAVVVLQRSHHVARQRNVRDFGGFGHCGGIRGLGGGGSFGLRFPAHGHPADHRRLSVQGRHGVGDGLGSFHREGELVFHLGAAHVLHRTGSFGLAVMGDGEVDAADIAGIGREPGVPVAGNNGVFARLQIQLVGHGVARFVVAVQEGLAFIGQIHVVQRLIVGGVGIAPGVGIGLFLVGRLVHEAVAHQCLHRGIRCGGGGVFLAGIAVDEVHQIFGHHLDGIFVALGVLHLDGAVRVRKGVGSDAVRPGHAVHCRQLAHIGGDVSAGGKCDRRLCIHGQRSCGRKDHRRRQHSGCNALG